MILVRLFHTKDTLLKKMAKFYLLKVLIISDLREVQNPGGLTLTLVASFKQAKGVFPLSASSAILNVFSHWLGLEAPSRIFHVTSAFTWKSQAYVRSDKPIVK